VLDGQGARDLGQVARELGGLPQLALAQLLQGEAEGLLEQVLGFGPAVGMAVEDDRDTAAVELDDLLLRPPVAGQDARDQLLGSSRDGFVADQDQLPRRSSSRREGRTLAPPRGGLTTGR
jgi:hypothetical protein